MNLNLPSLPHSFEAGELWVPSDEKISKISRKIDDIGAYELMSSVVSLVDQDFDFKKNQFIGISRAASGEMINCIGVCEAISICLSGLGLNAFGLAWDGKHAQIMLNHKSISISSDLDKMGGEEVINQVGDQMLKSQSLIFDITEPYGFSELIKVIDHNNKVSDCLVWRHSKPTIPKVMRVYRGEKIGSFLSYVQKAKL
jgi:hypothetical protein